MVCRWLLAVGIAAMFGLAGGYCLGEEGGALRLSMDQSVEIALRNNRTLAAAAQERVKADGRVMEARAEALPRLSIGVRATHLGEKPTADFAGTTTPLGKQDNYTLSADLSQPLYKGGKVRAGLRGARLFEEYSDEGVRLTLHQVTARVKEAYLNVLLQEELLSVEKQRLELASRHLQDVTVRKEAGSVTNFEVVRAQVEVASARASVTEMKNGLNLARKEFLNALGLSLDTDFALTEGLEYSEVRTEAGPPQADSAEATLAATAGKAALGNRPDLAQARLAIDMQEENLKAVRSDLLPQAFVTGNWEGGSQSQYSLGGTGDWQEGWSVGLSVSLALFDGMRTRGKLVQEQAALEQYRLSMEDLEKNILLEVRDSVLNLESAAELVKSQQEAVSLAEEGERLARDRYNAGAATQLDVLDAQVALSSARSGLARAIYGQQVALRELERATGTADRRSLLDEILK